jgi:hypothetical protein
MPDEIVDPPASGATSTPEADVAPAAAEDKAAPAATATPAAAEDKAAPATTEPSGNDWAALRTKYAKGDEKLAARLGRYSSAEAALDALVAAQNKISSGGLKAPLSEDPTPEELKAWRAENGIPETPEGYEIKIPEGLDVDEKGIEGAKKLALEKNIPPAHLQALTEYQFQLREQAILEQQTADATYREQAEESLREEWGSEFKLNKNMINGLLDTAPEGVKGQLLGGRLADGTVLANDPKVLRWLASLAREVNPTATVVPGSGTNSVQAIESEIAGLKKLMGDRTSEYWKGPTAEKMQARYRDLVDVQAKINK